MVSALADAVVPLRSKQRPSNYDRRKMIKAAKSLEGLTASTHVGKVDDWTANALGKLATSTPLPRVEADGVEYLEPDYRTAKQKKRDKKAARKAAKKSDHASPEAKVVTEPEPLPKVTKPKEEKAPVQKKKQVQLAPKTAVTSWPVPAKKEEQGDLDDHNRTSQFIGLLESAGADEAYQFLRDSFGVDDSRNSSRVSSHCEALMMEYISAHAHTFLAASLHIEQRPYGEVDPHFTEYKSRRSESMWQHHNGPMVTMWQGKRYTVSESHGYWEAMGTDDERWVDANRVRGHRIPVGYLQWLEGNTGMEKMVCLLGKRRDEPGPLRSHNWTREKFARNYPLRVGDLVVGVERSTIECWVPHNHRVDSQAREARVVRSNISRNTVAGRLADPVVTIEPAKVADNVISIADFAERQAANSADYLADVDAQSFDGSAALVTPPDTRRLETQEPDASVVAPAHLQVVKARHQTVDRNHQRMLSFRDSTLTRMLPRYVVHNTEAAPVTTQTVVQEVLVKAPAMPDNRNTLTLMGKFDHLTVAAQDVVASDERDGTLASKRAHYKKNTKGTFFRTRPLSDRQLSWQLDETEAMFDRIVELARWRNGRESRAAWENDKRELARYEDSRLGYDPLADSWLSAPKRAGLPVYSGSLTKAERLVRLGNTRLLNEPTYTPREMQLIHESDEVRYSEWANAQPHTDLQLWFERTAWLEDHPGVFTTMDMAYACVRTSVAGHHNVGDTVSSYGDSLNTEQSVIVLPAAGLELSGQGEALVVDVTGNELVADKPSILTEPDTIDRVIEDSIFSQIMASVPGAMTAVQSALVEAIDTGVPISEVRRLASQYSLESKGGILVA